MKTFAYLLALSFPALAFAGDAILGIPPRHVDDKMLNDPRLDVKKMIPSTPIQLTPEQGAALIASAVPGPQPKPSPELVKYYQQEFERAKKDPLYDAKVRAAYEVASDRVIWLVAHGEVRRTSCTDPNDWGRNRTVADNIQRWILKKKFDVDWSAPPVERWPTKWQLLLSK